SLSSEEAEKITDKIIFIYILIKTNLES
ncbi:MAG: hypothetical protein RL059_973, partial [Bacteroidota bacterium]